MFAYERFDRSKAVTSKQCRLTYFSNQIEKKKDQTILGIGQSCFFFLKIKLIIVQKAALIAAVITYLPIIVSMLILSCPVLKI